MWVKSANLRKRERERDAEIYTQIRRETERESRRLGERGVIDRYLEDHVLICELIERGEEGVQQFYDPFGRQGLGDVGPVDNVREDYGHRLVGLAHLVLAVEQSLDDVLR